MPMSEIDQTGEGREPYAGMVGLIIALQGSLLAWAALYAAHRLLA